MWFRLPALSALLLSVASAQVSLVFEPAAPDTASDAIPIMPVSVASKTCFNTRCSGQLNSLSFAGEDEISFTFRASSAPSSVPAPLFNFESANKGAKIEIRLVSLPGQLCGGLAQDVYGDRLSVLVSASGDAPSGEVSVAKDDSFVLIEDVDDTCVLSTRLVLEGQVPASVHQVVVRASIDTTSGPVDGIDFTFDGSDSMHILNYADPSVEVKFKVHQNFDEPSCQGLEPFITVTDQRTEAPTADEPRIVGGSNTRRNQYPSMVSVQRYGRHHCGGTLISPNWVLSAAHCFRHDIPLTVFIGAHHIQDANENGREVIRVNRVIMHPRYVRIGTRNDVALLRLARRSRSTSFARLDFGLPNPGSFSRPGTNSVAVGWGRLTQGGAWANALQHVTVPVVSHRQCLRAYPNRIFEDEMICAGFPRGGRDACQGDSGGPLFNAANPDVQIGVVSWGSGCARPNAFGVYARVRSYGSFVRQHVRNLPDHRSPRSVFATSSNLVTKKQHMLPGSYQVTAAAPGCTTTTTQALVTEDTTKTIELNCVCSDVPVLVPAAADADATGQTTANSSNSSNSNSTNRVVAGVIGGVVGVAAVVGVAVFVHHSRRKPVRGAMRSGLMTQHERPAGL